MSHAHPLTSLNELTLTIAKDGHAVASRPVGDVASVSAGTQVAVDGKLPKSLFVYVLQLGANGQVLVLHHPNEKSPAGTDIKIPEGGEFLTTAIEGEITAVGADTKVMDSEWPSLLGGHDGDTGHAHIGQSTVGKPPAPPVPPPVKPTTPPTSSSGH